MLTNYITLLRFSFKWLLMPFNLIRVSLKTKPLGVFLEERGNILTSKNVCVCCCFVSQHAICVFVIIIGRVFLSRPGPDCMWMAGFTPSRHAWGAQSMIMVFKIEIGHKSKCSCSITYFVCAWFVFVCIICVYVFLCMCVCAYVSM